MWHKEIYVILFPRSDKMTVNQIIFLALWMHLESIQGFNNGIPNPCPVGMNNPVVDMCMNSSTLEIKGNGAEYLDSVVLRAMVDRGGCTCDVLIENYIEETAIFLEKYRNMSTAAPENNLCGIAIDIEMVNDEYVYKPIECTSGVDRREFAILKTDVLRFTSRIIQGNFTQGYCLHIIRDKKTNNKSQRLKIVCNESEVFRHESSSMNPTATKSELQDDETLVIAIGTCVGVLVMIIIASIFIIITKRYRRISNKRLNELQRNTVPDSNAENDDAQYDGLKDNVLYVSATQHQDVCINYSIVDFERQRMAARHSEIDNHYNTVESNEGTMSLQTLKTFHDNETITNNEISKSSNQTLGPSNACSVVYAVVDKGLRNPIHSSSTKIQDDVNSHQAYAIVDKTRNQDP